MSFLGSFYIDQLITFTCNTHKNDASSDADSAPAYRVYEDETATPILTGSLATLDSSNTDGFYSEQITASTANGFEYGRCYTVRLSATVDSVIQAMDHNFIIKTEAEHNIKTAGGLILIGTVSDADHSPTTTVFEMTGTGLTDSTTDHYKGMFVKVASGNNKHEVKQITASSVVATNVRFTVETLSAALANGVTVMVF
jgi:hypothetical protein